ncbi:methyltransferase domain-containing protein [Allosphingosinicella deserti]|uniref:Uncharacterized protein n=1 Tax=Allosphingosinicella deserti TaxID=2116704 RepID=A0A2P7QF67_9SPHN|nr:hypothetical protein [Sphingomonas deserti]PSJ36628.1 hypothetical protein C7I55_24865 [Sphingomonas deserti]
MTPLRIYLSGSIRKGAGDPRSPDHFWTPDDEEFIRADVGVPVELLNPAKTDIRRQDFALNFGCDLHLVSISDVVLVDARKEKGIGVGAEMMFAAQRGIPIITWAPEDTHYRRRKVADVFGEDLTDWTHPFVFGLSDHVVDELAQATALIRALARGTPIPRTVAVERHMERYRLSAARERAGERFVNIGGGVYQDLVGGGAPIEMIGGAPRHRFMDFLYLPTPTALLPPEAMLCVNRWRERRLAERPLLHSSRVRRIAAAVARTLSDLPRIFEIGCGKFPLADDIHCASWTGLEIDPEAVAHLASRGLRCIASPLEVKSEDLRVDLVAALFCMQFSIDDAELALLARLADEAVVLFNIPTRDEALARRRLQQARVLGLSASVLDLHPLGVNDALVLAGCPRASGRVEAAKAAILAQAALEWQSAGATLRWTESEKD